MAFLADERLSVATGAARPSTKRTSNRARLRPYPTHDGRSDATDVDHPPDQEHSRRAPWGWTWTTPSEGSSSDPPDLP